MIKVVKYISLITLLILVFLFGCPFMKIFKLPCPACGVTRAWIYLLKGNVKFAFESNPMFIPLSFLFLRIFYCGIRNKKIKGLELGCFYLIVFLSFSFNLFRILAWL